MSRFTINDIFTYKIPSPIAPDYYDQIIRPTIIIIGLGGVGFALLELVLNVLTTIHRYRQIDTPINIHLFDDDELKIHNMQRTMGYAYVGVEGMKKVHAAANAAQIYLSKTLPEWPTEVKINVYPHPMLFTADVYKSMIEDRDYAYNTGLMKPSLIIEATDRKQTLARELWLTTRWSHTYPSTNYIMRAGYDARPLITGDTIVYAVEFGPLQHPDDEQDAGYTSLDTGALPDLVKGMVQPSLVAILTNVRIGMRDGGFYGPRYLFNLHYNIYTKMLIHIDVSLGYMQTRHPTL